ncbi:MAG: amidohydrolase family protein [Desulfurococcaceae archaeon]
MVVEKVSILIKNGLVVTMDAFRRVFSEGYVAIDEGRIVGVGKGDPGGKYSAEEVIDARRAVVLPGLICVHTHLYGALLRASPWFLKIDQPTDFQQSLQRVWWVLDELLTHDDIYASALYSSMELARTGTTLFYDTLSAPKAIEGSLSCEKKAIEEVGIRGILSFEATERHSLEEGIRGLAENEKFVKENPYTLDKLIMGAVSLHASFTVSNELLHKAKEISDKHSVPITMHIEEGLIDVYHNIERYGLRPIERLEKEGFLSPKLVAAHVVHVTMEELIALKRNNVKVAHNAMSNMLNAVGVSPVPKMLEFGIVVGIGNDGYILDIFENIRATYLIHKVANKDPRLMPPDKIVEMATIDAARVLELEKHVGSLEVGKRADVVIVRPELTPTPINEDTVYGHIVNTFTGRDVDTVIVNGREVLRGRKFIAIDALKELDYVHKVAARLWDRLLSKGSYQLDFLN